MSSPRCANVFHCVDRCELDIDSISYLIPVIIRQCFHRPVALQDVYKATNGARIAVSAVWLIYSFLTRLLSDFSSIINLYVALACD